MMEKKGDLSISLIVMIALGLLILVILAFGISNGWFKLSQGSKCITEGGICKTFCAPGENPRDTSADGKQLCTTGKTCCLVVG